MVGGGFVSRELPVVWRNQMSDQEVCVRVTWAEPASQRIVGDSLACPIALQFYVCNWYSMTISSERSSIYRYGFGPLMLYIYLGGCRLAVCCNTVRTYQSPIHWGLVLNEERSFQSRIHIATQSVRRGTSNVPASSLSHCHTLINTERGGLLI